jgi:hypothetical protein
VCAFLLWTQVNLKLKISNARPSKLHRATTLLNLHRTYTRDIEFWKVWRHKIYGEDLSMLYVCNVFSPFKYNLKVSAREIKKRQQQTHTTLNQTDSSSFYFDIFPCRQPMLGASSSSRTFRTKSTDPCTSLLFILIHISTVDKISGAV